MPRLIKKMSKAKGLTPGTVLFIGEKKLEQTQIRIIDYDKEALEEKLSGEYTIELYSAETRKIYFLNRKEIADL